MWLRGISSRLVALYFSTMTEACKKNDEETKTTEACKKKEEKANQSISSRLVKLYIYTVTEEKDEKPDRSYFLMRPSRLFMIAVSLCCQLKTKVGDDAASDLIVQNLVLTISCVHSLMGQLECGEPQKFWSTLEPNEQGYFLKALKLLDSGKGQSMFLSLTSDKFEKKDDTCAKDIRHLLVCNLLKKMGKVALQMEDVQVCIPLY